MTTKLYDAKAGADRILAKLIERESQGIRDALGAKDYEKAGRWAKKMADTLKMLNRELEARKND
jgi:hypothetical protein